MSDMSRGKSSRLSARVADDVMRRLSEHSARRAVSRSALTERYIDEGMRMEDHPGIVFRDGPTGRRAGLAGGPDVWEVISVLRDQANEGDGAVEAAAEWLSLSIADVRTALSYYGAFTDEVDARVQASREDAQAAEAAWRRGQAALA